MSAFKLRPYQNEAIRAVVEARQRGIKRMVICLPTGTGKTLIFSRLTRLARHQVMVIAHRAELLEQARDKIQRTLGADGEGAGGLVAIEQGLRRAPAEAKVIVCSIRSLHEGRLGDVMKGRDIRLIVYDECHHAAADDNMRVLRQIGCFEDDWPGTLLGFTATPSRGDGKGLDEVFQEIVYSRGLPEMIRNGYLCKLRGYRIETAADLRALSGGGQDFNLEELAEAVDIETRNGLVARSVLELARDRRTIVFCASVNHARNLARTMNHIGLRAGMIYGEMHPTDRVRTLEHFREGRFQVLTNVGVLTEGFDDPEVSCVAIARPTRSEGLYAQCVGRGTRLYPDKEDCLVLDFVDLSNLHLVTLPTLFGMPRNLDLEGRDVEEAQKDWRQLLLDLPGFDFEEAESLTLQEIRERAEAFDPLTLDIDPEIVAISENAWVSLGKPGLALHFMARPGRPSEFLVLDKGAGGARGKKYVVSLDGKEVARFSRVEQAVEAVDFELSRRGRKTAESARDFAGWRFDPPPAELVARLSSLRPPRRVDSWGEALRLLAWATHATRGKRR